MQSKYIKMGLVVVLLALVVGAVYFVSTRCGGEKTIVIMGEDVRIIEVCTNADRIKGLGGVALEDFQERADGMVFRFDVSQERNFWMKNMQFPIDIVWISEGRIVKIDKEVPAPEKGEVPQTRSSQPFKVDTVLEFPSGGADKYGLALGSPIPSLR